MMKNPFSLRKDISLALILKLILIFLLWALFFQHPVEEHLSDRDIMGHIVDPE